MFMYIHHMTFKKINEILYILLCALFFPTKLCVGSCPKRTSQNTSFSQLHSIP